MIQHGTLKFKIIQIQFFEEVSRYTLFQTVQRKNGFEIEASPRSTHRVRSAPAGSVGPKGFVIFTWPSVAEQNKKAVARYTKKLPRAQITATAMGRRSSRRGRGQALRLYLICILPDWPPLCGRDGQRKHTR